ncbi:MAG: hypothetical protein JNJ40_16430 [Bacteroidia bacterium]|nr:hypothetical protein [Bacteroidia bacterium]
MILKPEEKIFYRTEFSRLLGSKDLKVMAESHKLISDVGFSVFFKHGQTGNKLSAYDHDGNILFQMSILKSLSLQELAKSINYVNDIDGSSLKNTYDPFGMYNIVRAQYEAFCNFNNIYIQSKTESELKLKYYLWVLSGLNYRQRFRADSEWAIKKKANEAIEIQELNELISNNECYKELEEQSQKNIQDCINKKDWQIKIEGKKAYKIAWHEMMTNAGANKMLENQYSQLFLATHPSNVSVFQFSSMYIENMQEFNTKKALQLSKVFIAMMIRDYVIYFKLEETNFNNLPFIPQALINSYNEMFRNEKFKINNLNSSLN